MGVGGVQARAEEGAPESRNTAQEWSTRGPGQVEAVPCVPTLSSLHPSNVGVLDEESGTKVRCGAPSPLTPNPFGWGTEKLEAGIPWSDQQRAAPPGEGIIRAHNATASVILTPLPNSTPHISLVSTPDLACHRSDQRGSEREAIGPGSLSSVRAKTRTQRVWFRYQPMVVYGSIADLVYPPQISFLGPPHKQSYQ